MLLPESVSSRLAPAVSSLVNEMLSYVVNEDTNPIETYLDALQTSPILGTALDVRVLLGLSFFDQYTHEDENIQAFIRQNFEQMKGSLNLSIGELLCVDGLGYAASEWYLREPENGSWYLGDILILDPRKYTFKGTMSEGVTELEYMGNTQIKIPYENVIHVTARRWLGFRNPYGVSHMRMAVAAWKAWKIVVSELLIATQRQGTGLMVGYADSTRQVPLLDPYGNPFLDNNGDPILVPAPNALLKQMENLENRSVLATDIGNRIEMISQTEGRSFFTDVLKTLQSLQLLAFGVPETIFSATGTGDSNLNTGHRSLLTQSIRASVEQIKEQLLEKIVRPLITWEFGENVENYGSFPEPEQEEGDRVALMGAITNAISSTAFSTADLDVINRLRKLAGIPEVSEIASAIVTNSRRPLDYWRNDAA